MYNHRLTDPSPFFYNRFQSSTILSNPFLIHTVDVQHPQGLSILPLTPTGATTSPSGLSSLLHLHTAHAKHVHALVATVVPTVKVLANLSRTSYAKHIQAFPSSTTPPTNSLQLLFCHSF